MNRTPLISVFIPVYNGERYLGKTLSSVLQQSYSNFEVFIVNDSSTDQSEIICKEFSEKDNRFKVFTKPKGGNTSISWNFILPKINGDFVFYLSQDDLIDPNLFEKAITKQMATNADCVLPDLEFYFESKKGEKLIGFDGNRNIELSNVEAFTNSLDWKIHGFGIYKASLYENEVYPEDVFDSDEYMTRKLFLKCNKIAFCESVFYYRQDNPNAITKVFAEKNFYRLLTFKRVYNLIVQYNLSDEIRREYLYRLNHYYLDFKRKFRGFKFYLDSDNKVLQFLNSFKDELIELNNELKTAPFSIKLVKQKMIAKVVKYDFLEKMFCIYKQI